MPTGADCPRARFRGKWGWRGEGMKPILFSTPMVQAILAGNKTQTRRVVNPQPIKGCMPNKYAAPYQHGDILWVRETFFVEPCQDDCAGRKDKNECPFNRVGDKCYGYRQQFVDGGRGVNIAWKTSIHMPRAAARIFLRVTDVRVERVQDISEEDAIAEGCKGVPCDHSMGRYACEDCMNSGWREPPQLEFMELWEQINAKRGWWEEERSFGEIIALCHSELSEALEEYRNGKPMIYYKDIACLDGEIRKQSKPEGIAIELADCIIRILDYCGKAEIDIDTALKIKHEYNKTRPYRHGGKVI